MRVPQRVGTDFKQDVQQNIAAVIDPSSIDAENTNLQKRFEKVMV